MEFTSANDNYNDYYAVCEQAVTNADVNILEEVKHSGELSFLRFTACLQDYGGRNRNGRRWFSKFMRPMIETPEVKELLNAGGVPGENGHPINPNGKTSIERILTIDPNNISHLIKNYWWKTENRLYGTIETVDGGPGSPGYTFMRNILQHMDPSFSTRAIIPQRKNPDGSIDMTGPGRYVTHDRVILPSHSCAYIDKSIPVKNITTKSHFEQVMESAASYVLDSSDKVNRIIDGMDPVMESATVNTNGIFTINTNKNGTIIIAPEMKHRKDISDFMMNL